MDNIDLRDYFAGQAIAGILGTLPGRQWEQEQNTAELAQKAYAIADALIAEGKKGRAAPVPNAYARAKEHRDG